MSSSTSVPALTSLQTTSLPPISVGAFPHAGQAVMSPRPLSQTELLYPCLFRRPAHGAGILYCHI